MEYSEVLEKRKSVRAFKDKDISDDDVRKLLEASMLAPSAGGLQAYKIVVVRNAERKEKLVQAALGQSFIAEAPACFVVCADAEQSRSRYGGRGANLYCIQDATIIAAYIQLTATDMGLASVWVGAFDEEKVAETINAPAGVRPIALIPVGHATEDPQRTPRRCYEDAVENEEFR